MTATEEIVQLNKQTEVYKTFEEALNNACGEISEAARLSPEIFEGDELNSLLLELGLLMGHIDTRILKSSHDDEEAPDCEPPPDSDAQVAQMDDPAEIKRLFEEALDNARGGINDAARLSPEIFEGDELKRILGELARLTGIINDRISKRSVPPEE
jgi:hypothetical protein